MQLLVKRWPIFIAAAGVLIFVGGPMHPDPPDTLPYKRYMAAMLSDSTWVAAHLPMLLGVLAAALGLTGLARSGVLTKIGTTAATVAAIGAFGTVVELAFHTAAAVDRDSFIAGGSTPILNTHLALAFVTAPILGLSLAVLMVAEIRRLGAVWFVVSVLGTIGAVAWAASAPIVTLTENPAFSPLFKSATNIAVWFLALAVVSPRLRDRASLTTDGIEPAAAV